MSSDDRKLETMDEKSSVHGSVDKSGGVVTETQANAEYLNAIASAPLDAWSRSSIALYGFVIVCALNATMSGYDGAIFSTINAMPAYKSFFNMTETGASTGIIFAIYPIGQMVGAFFAGLIADWLGRRAGLFAGAAFVMFGTIWTTSAQSLAYIFAGRFFLGFGISISTAAAPTLAVELSPPQWRGVIVGYYNSFFYTGSVLAAGVTYACNKNGTEFAWRFPLGLQMLAPLIIVLCSLFIPESPRWLMLNGKKEKAVEFLTKYHGGGDPNHPLVLLEIREIEESVADKSPLPWWDYRPLFNSHEARWRMAMNLFMGLSAQMSGNSVLTYFLPTMYSNLGIKSTDRRLLLTMANNIVGATGAVAGSWTNDRVGRRTKLWIGSLVLCLLLSAVTGFSSMFNNPKSPVSSAYSNAGVAFIFLFGCAYAFVYTPLTATYSVEVQDNVTRAKAYGVKIVFNGAYNFFNTYVTSIALKEISFYYYIIFIGLDAIYTAIWFFFGVETLGRTLEELQEVFQDPFPPAAALRKRTVVQKADGHVEEV
ncbi:general substrate transporter [Auriculariales sp. MPI-PUGE-AT-0066]|nr:general substrate transporter [Auriculariales sp. MPI-PUGE-AT-0066]